MKITILILLFALTYTVYGKPTANDDYDPTFGENDDPDMQKDDYGNTGDDEYDESDNVDDDDEAVPIITTKPKVFNVKPHDSVLLPCEIDGNIDTYVVMWQKHDTIIFQDKIALGNFSHDKFVLKNKSLQIKNVDESDASDYSCKIIVSGDQPTVTHQVHILGPVKITGIGADRNIMEYKTGDTMVLTCNASGDPDPKITWSFKGQRMQGQGKTLVISNIAHSDMGTYQCLAENGIGQPAHESITIRIKHKPVVNFEKIINNINESSYDVELKCTVHSVPDAIITWKKDGEVMSSAQYTFRRKNGIHSTRINGVQKANLGKYSCKAENEVGKTEQHLLLTNAPGQPKKKSFTHNKAAKEVIFVWEVESLLSPISEHIVMYKKKSDTEWISQEAEVTNGQNYMYELKHTISGLENGEYDIKAKSKNVYGWSEDSKISEFKVQHKAHHGHKKQHTNNAEEEHNMTELHPKHVEEPPADATTSGASTIIPTTLTLLTCFTLLNRH